METILKFKSISDLVSLIDYGSMSMIVRSARAGWSDGVTVILDLLHDLSINVEPETFQKEFFPSVKGLFYDIGLVCTGVPEHWFDPQQTENNSSFSNQEHNDERNVIKLNINSTLPSNIKDSSVIERGAALIVLAYILEQSGRTVSITQYCASTEGNQSFYGSVNLKEANQPLDMDVLSFWLMNSESYYGCWYRIMENIPNAHKMGILNGHYGTPEIDYGKENSNVFAKGFNKFSKNWSRQDSLDWIKEKLTDLNIKYN